MACAFFPVQGVWLGKALAGLSAFAASARGCFLPAAVVFLGQNFCKPGSERTCHVWFSGRSGPLRRRFSPGGAEPKRHRAKESLLSIILFRCSCPFAGGNSGGRPCFRRAGQAAGGMGAGGLPAPFDAVFFGGRGFCFWFSLFGGRLMLFVTGFWARWAWLFANGSSMPGRQPKPQMGLAQKIFFYIFTCRFPGGR